MSLKNVNKPLLLETIKIENGVISNLEYHQKRCDASRKELYGLDDTLTLKEVILPPKEGLYRCRIIYASSIQSIEYIPYIPRVIESLKVVPSSIEYHLKYSDRSFLAILLEQHPEVDDVIIETEGYLRDTTIANIAFYDGKHWYTPTCPLLHGTMRQKLLDEGFLRTKKIRKEDLPLYTQVALMNAMIGFTIIKDIKILR